MGTGFILLLFFSSVENIILVFSLLFTLIRLVLYMLGFFSRYGYFENKGNEKRDASIDIYPNSLRHQLHVKTNSLPT